MFFYSFLSFTEIFKAGLDPVSRKSLNSVLQELHHRSFPRIILGFRKGEEIPTWVTHVLEIQGCTALSRVNDVPHTPQRFVNRKPRLYRAPTRDDKKSVADLKGINVSYGDRSVSTFYP